MGQIRPRLKLTTLLDMNPTFVRERLDGIPELARSMEVHGQLYPAIVREDGVLISGARRLAAAQLLRWEEMSAVVTDNHDTVLDLMIKERENDNDPDVDPVLKTTPMRWVEVAELLAQALRPMEVRERMRHRSSGHKAEYEEGPYAHLTRRMRRMHTALGVEVNIYKAYGSFAGALERAPTTERRRELRAFLIDMEDRGFSPRYAQRLLAANAAGNRRPVIPPGDRPDDQLKAKIQQEKLDGVVATLRLLGSELEAAFSYVSPVAERAWLDEAWMALNDAEKPFRTVRARMRVAYRNKTEENR